VIFCLLKFSIYFELLPPEIEFKPKVLFVNRPEVEFKPKVLFVNRPEVELPELEVVEFVFESPPNVVVELVCENANVVNEATAAKTALIIVTVKIIPMLIFVLLLLINYNLL
jgi:hypothetical protein